MGDGLRGSRVGATAALLVGLVLLAQLRGVWSAAPYLGVLDGACALGVLAVGARLWHREEAEMLAVAITVVALSLGGQLVATLVGLPGASVLEGSLGPWRTTATLIEAIALGLLLRAAARSSR